MILQNLISIHSPFSIRSFIVDYTMLLPTFSSDQMKWKRVEGENLLYWIATFILLSNDSMLWNVNVMHAFYKYVMGINSYNHLSWYINIDCGKEIWESLSMYHKKINFKKLSIFKLELLIC